MFYCDKCAENNKWVTTIMRSEGSCEICGKIESCNDTPSSWLPIPKDNN